ncbi:hypothetical protein [Phenylobacterium sp. 58.2.17]|uniref:hypothetical protein n=1 Tax=Phenylobacterium sp. 58.2.17 TaxID=2969306 RepID=UPI002264E485|nr:hypothetical protein [Phenylobacterium sp. 58.2.17]MCX7585049.1 hypothetical protein [Phenylobacterium sp. 58.2.17]
MSSLQQSLERVEALLGEASGVALSTEPRRAFSLIVEAQTLVAQQRAGLSSTDAVQPQALGGSVQ